MDPLSLSASVAGLVTAADLTFTRTFKYVKGVKGASKEISNLSSELGALYGILNSLHLVACQLEGQSFVSTVKAHYIDACDQTLQKLKGILDRHELASARGHTIEAVKQKLKWPFSTAETKALIGEVERHKSTLSLALSVDGTASILQALAEQKEIHKSVEDMNRDLQRQREDIRRNVISEMHQDMLNAIGPIDPHRNHEMNLRLWYPKTGEWLITCDKFRNWLITENSQLWLWGIPGAGKTILCASVIQVALEKNDPGIAVAFFYCDYKDPMTQDPSQILGSIAKQLAIQNEQSFGMLQEFYRENNRIGNRPGTYDSEALRDLIVVMALNFDSTMVIVDALDECGANTRAVVDLLASLNTDRTRSSIKTLFLSRTEQDIMELLKHYIQIPVAATSKDLRLYVGAEIHSRTRNGSLRIKDPLLRDHSMERLVEGADGMFRWAACQIDYLCELPTDLTCKEALNSLPPTLNATYERILRRVNKSNRYIQVLVQRSLRWISDARGSLSIAAMAEAVSVELGAQSLKQDAIPAEEIILKWCSSLVRRKASGVGLDFAHFTVKEFLTAIDEDPYSEFGLYRISHERNDLELAEVCVTYLCLSDFADTNISEGQLRCRDEEYAFRSYAVDIWMDHVRPNLSNPRLLSMVQQMLHPARSDAFISWAQEYIYLMNR